jgi:hypothetical protein
VKAKMPPSEKPPESGQYECLWCDTTFWYESGNGDLSCPKCHNADRRDLVPIYMQDSIIDQTMYTSADWQGGD